MVCLACLLPLFLVPIVNLLPLLFSSIMARIYRLMGWDYRKPERAPPTCPYKPSASKADSINTDTGEQNKGAPHHSQNSVAVDTGKQD